jgi:hypothetical protein
MAKKDDGQTLTDKTTNDLVWQWNKAFNRKWYWEQYDEAMAKADYSEAEYYEQRLIEFGWWGDRAHEEDEMYEVMRHAEVDRLDELYGSDYWTEKQNATREHD